ncbi:MAG: hypothetical protein Q8L72_00655 [Moraxellaceae bacterium]|nr:hypothetical protein [Moraxellaceae bacterium]
MSEEGTEMILPTEKIKNLKTAIDGLEGIPIPYNIIKNQLEPLRRWCIEMLEEEGTQ